MWSSLVTKYWFDNSSNVKACPNNAFKLISELKNEVNIKLDSGWTPLMHACFHAQDKIVKFLLDKGADPNLHAGIMFLVYMHVCAQNINSFQLRT